MPTDDLHFKLLRELTREPSASQRRLGERLGISVGKVNYCLRAVIDKGWVKANNFRRSDNKWAYTYLLTPSGASEKVRMTQRFIERKELEFECLLSEIRALRAELQPNGALPAVSKGVEPLHPEAPPTTSASPFRP